MTDSRPQPRTATTPAEFAALMRRLRAWSGCSYRQLERRAEAVGDILPRATLADALNRRDLPREDLLAAFVRACGADDDTVAEWVDARRRLAVARETTTPLPGGTPAAAGGETRVVASDEMPAAPSPASAPPAAGLADDAGGSGTGRVPASSPVSAVSGRKAPVGRRLVAGVAAAALLSLIGAWQFDRISTGVATSHTSSTGQAGSDEAARAGGPAPARRWVRVRPAADPSLCLTAGRARDVPHDDEVAVLRPCAAAVPPRTFLTPAGDGLFRLQWDHPDPAKGVGCLTVIPAGPAAGMLEPWNDCTGARPNQRFRLEPTGGDGYRIRPASSGRCLAVNGDDGEPGAEAVERPCASAAGQTFLIEPE
ncbi:RICIN domain-containing protein [Microbispora sp. KK1-11]|uniref:RICIN domain-containing protein n=1 Tax=Microbispora sp. KK1-11 TaxID=2053005 RepID=UPI001158C579|nr:RICIN domain-containing protein [Microbispora sp. KK1-11]TQS23093.1 helix-turn-helix domain-containing protein [Microbispora sp. KK1-11]